MRVIVLNQNNLVQDGQNNKLIYKFPNSVQFKNNHIAVSSVSMYYSWFNITSAYSNNSFSYTWVVGSTTTTYTITIPDGLYQITDLNNLLQYNMAKNGTYLTNSGSNAYYAEFILNPTRYAVQINTFLVPTSLPSGYTAPSNWVGYATQSFNPSITIPAKLNTIFGYGAGFVSNQNTNNAYTPPTATASNNYVSKNTSNTLSYLSNRSPNLQPNSSIYFSLSNINNPYSLPSSIIYSLVPQGDVGTLIVERPPQFMWNKMIDGTYNQLTLTFLGTDLQPIIINDPSMTILLTIKDGDELGGKV
jgi:hypothetical protein